MKWINRRGYRLLLSYPFAVWGYGIIFAFVSGFFPATAADCMKFALMPFLVTIQLPFLYISGHGWLFTIVVAVIWASLYYLLKFVADRKQKALPDGTAK